MKYLKGNLLEATATALVNTVNTVGVMGKGIALQFKEAFPVNYKAYVTACKKGELVPGKLLIVKEQTFKGEKIIINFPTKTEWFLKSKYEYIEKGLIELARIIQEEKIDSIAIPPLGCGNGGLQWDKVKQLIEQHLGHLTNVEIEIYEPNETVKDTLQRQTVSKVVKLTPARAMLLYAMFYYEATGETSSLFVANKLAYFLQRLGETSFKKLSFKASHYGPYDVGVEHMLHNLNGTYLKGLEQMNVKAFEGIELQYDKMNEVSDYVKKELTSAQKDRLKKLIRIIDGFQSALSLETLATVDFIRKDKPNISFEEVVETIGKWSVRKQKLFQEKFIKIAMNHLEDYSNSFEVG